MRETPLTSRHRDLGARLVPFAGYAMPIQYVGIKHEHCAVREKAGLFDVSHMGEMRLRGEGTAELVNRLVTNDLDRIEPGQAMYTCCCRDDGGILDDLIVYKRSERDVLIVCNASNRDKIANHFAEHSRPATGIEFCDESDDTALLALQGPQAFDVLDAVASELGAFSSRLRPFRFGAIQLGELPLTVARTGYTGEDGVELFAPSGQAGELWDRLMAAGKKLGLEPVGLGARDTLRLEARLSLYGNELGETINPLEAGLGWVVKLKKTDFVGKAALERVRASGPSRQIVGFEMRGKGIARAGYALKSASGDPLGHCTSGAPSPTLGKAIGLGFVPLGFARVGTELVVDCRGKDIPAEVVETPFYRRPTNA